MKHRSIYDRLVEQTVGNVLFCKPVEAIATTCGGSLNREGGAIEKRATTEKRGDAICRLLISEFTDTSKQDNNEDDAAARALCVLECSNWSIERLKSEKASIKRYLRAKLAYKSQTSPEHVIIYEVYALLKLFVLERDFDYRQQFQQSISCPRTFQTSLHVLLSLYATYFERAHGRQISTKIDVKPIETLYCFFLTN